MLLTQYATRVDSQAQGNQYAFFPNGWLMAELQAYRALALDLDGTLLVGEHLPADNLEALQAARQAGLTIIVATARWKEAALGIARQAGVHDPVIACSGAQVHDPASGLDIFDRRLPLQFVRELLAICNAERCIATLTYDALVHIKLEGRPDPALMGPEMRAVAQLTLDEHDLPRVAAIQGSRANARIRTELAPRFRDRVNIFDSIGPTGKIILTLTAKQATKGAALNAACAHLGLPAEAVVAFGDAENDLSMFAAAGAAVAMGQADEAVKKAASFVSEPHDRGGVAHAIDLLLRHGQLPRQQARS